MDPFGTGGVKNARGAALNTLTSKQRLKEMRQPTSVVNMDDFVLGDLPTKVEPELPAWLPKLGERLKAGVKQYFDTGSRPEDGYAHVSDLSGKCDRETWARRNGLTSTDWDYESMAKMDMGTLLEPWLLERLEAGFIEDNYTVEHQVPVSLWMEGGQLTGSRREFERSSAMVVRGTLDAIYTHKETRQKVVIDIKTGASIKEKYQYRLQVSAYSLATGSPYAGLLYFSRLDGKAYGTFWETETMRKALTDRFNQVVSFTKIGDPMPPAEPADWTYNTSKAKGRVSWACSSYCGFLDCEKNGRNK